MPDERIDSEPIEIPPLTGIYAEPFSLGKLVRLAGFFGPAAVITSLSLGAGETIMVTGLGAWSEFDLLWLLLLSVIVKGVFVTYLVGRYTAITGEKIGNRLAKLPGPRGWILLAVVVVEVCLLSTGLTAVAKPCGNLIAFLSADHLGGTLDFDTWQNIFTSLLLGAALSLSIFTSFEKLQTQQIVICGVIVAGTIVATLMVRPDYGRLLMGAVSFGHLPDVPAWGPTAAKTAYVLNLVTIFGYIGGSLSGHLVYSSWISRNGWGINSHPDIAAIRKRAERGIDYLPDDAAQARRLHVLLSPLRWDIGMGAVVLAVVTAAFLAAGATVLYPREQPIGDNAWELLTKQASIWRQIHSALVPVYYVAVVAALWGTLASIPEAISQMVHDFLSAIWPRFEEVSVDRVKTAIALWFFGTSMVWTWTGVSFTLLTALGAFFSLSLLLSVVFACVLYFNVTLPKRYRPQWWVTIGGVISAVVLFICAVGGAMGLYDVFVARL
ncbi:MAG: Nramp family divalent metal transporter [Planctomycetaceae bacterium]